MQIGQAINLQKQRGRFTHIIVLERVRVAMRSCGPLHRRM